jgi:dTDP-4-dehydrorhamnose 3,5-epimerase
MKITELEIKGLYLIEPKVFGDERGFFYESWHQEKYSAAGLPVANFVQDNLSMSRRGVLRGLHFQEPKAQGKLVSVLQGEVFDVAVDIRKDSPTFGQWQGILLSAENKKQFYLSPGFAHGFMVMSETALFFYKCTELYTPQNEGCILWNDPAINIEWPKEYEPILSDKDKNASTLQEVMKTL